MTYVIITDTHFGVKQNSMTWLNSQLDFIYKQFIPYVKSIEDSVTVVHLGDVFDSRSSISTYVGAKVVQAFKDIRKVCDEVIIVAGNHDFYSPNSDEVDTINLLLGHLDLTIVSKETLIKNGDAFVPWYKYGEELPDGFSGRVFTHADIVTSPIPECYSGLEIYSGHVHIPEWDEDLKLYNLGSCYSINFADANENRGFHMIKDKSGPTFIPNEHSIRFWRLFDDDIFDPFIEASMKDWDYVEFYISQDNLSNETYTEKLNEMSTRFSHSQIIPKVIEYDKMDMEKFDGYDIGEVIKSMIPENLKDKFGEVLQKVSTKLL